MVLGVIVMACVNAMIVPLALENQILMHPRSQPIFSAAQECGLEQQCWSHHGLHELVDLSQSDYNAKCSINVSHLQR